MSKSSCPIVYMIQQLHSDIEQYSQRYVDSQYACFLSADHPEDLETSKNAAAGRDIDLIVATDAAASFWASATGRTQR